MAVRFTRRFELGDRGLDVEAVGRALCRAGCGIPLPLFHALPKRVRRTWGKRKQAWLRTFKRRHGLAGTPTYGPRSHAKLSPFFDAYARELMARWKAPVRIVEPRQGFKSLHPALLEAYSIGRGLGFSDLGTYNPASRLPGGGKSDHAYFPARAFDLGISPQTGWQNEKARGFFMQMTRRDEVEYVILGDRIWSRSRGLHAYTAGGHMNHLHVSGRHSLLDRLLLSALA